ncbi:MAG: carboxypeptidase-like regulatory domain-containing protein, partial [Candidatus Baltobacteraceae bacterium]
MFSSRARAALVAAFTALLLLASSSGVAFAVGGQTGTLEGRVIDDAGLPIAGAAVSITSPSGAYATKTDTRGTFRIIGVLIDTYALSLTKEGFSPYSVAGITVPGDQTVALGALKLQRSMRTIAHVTSRSSSSAFQPGQTQDSITFSGKRVTEAQGKAFNTDQQALVASAPGVQVDQYGNLSIRGSLTNEIGLNLDGVDYTSIDQGGAMQSFLNGIGSLSVNPGAGDATENSSGAGAVNLIPKRGTYPAFGTLDLEAQSGYFNHQFGFEYGFATPDGRLSNYTSFTGQRFDSEYGPYGSALADAGPNVGQAAGFPSDYLAAQQGYSYDNDFLNNFIYKFGAHKAQSLQVLYQTHAGANTFDVGGLYPSYPYLSQSPIFGVGSFIANGGPYNNTDIAAGVIPLYPGQSNASQLDPNPSAQTNIVQFLKLEYDNNINASTFLATRLYHVGQVATDFDTNGTLSSFGGSNSPQQLGG